MSERYLNEFTCLYKNANEVFKLQEKLSFSVDEKIHDTMNINSTVIREDNTI